MSTDIFPVVRVVLAISTLSAGWGLRLVENAKLICCWMPPALLLDASGSAILAMEYAGLLGRDSVDLEIADPDFFTKIVNFLELHGVVIGDKR